MLVKATIMILNKIVWRSCKAVIPPNSDSDALQLCQPASPERFHLADVSKNSTCQT
jgi:hypothetical protein